MQDDARALDQAFANSSCDTAAVDALLDRMLARRRELARSVPGVVAFADVSSDPDFADLRTLRTIRPGS